MDARLTVRRAEQSDAQGIAEVHVRAWTEAYAHLVPAESLARQSVEQRALRWAEIISVGTAVWVGVDAGDDSAAPTAVDAGDDSAAPTAGEGVIVGFASSSTGHIDGPRNLELEALYILASHYGTGVGQALIAAAVSDTPAYLWVADDNPRARAFYARNGFVADGAEDIHSLAGTPVTAIRMVR